MAYGRRRSNYGSRRRATSRTRSSYGRSRTRRSGSRRSSGAQTLRIVLEQPSASLGREAFGLKPAPAPRSRRF
jgi:hypothetical protein